MSVPRVPAIVVIDIGKSNAKLALVDAETRSPVAVRTRANTVVVGAPYPHYDVDRLWAWILEGLAAFAIEAEIETISVTTHGACFACCPRQARAAGHRLRAHGPYDIHLLRASAAILPRSFRRPAERAQRRPPIFG
jgi:hypothetical protein